MREIAKGIFGPLYLAHTQGNGDSVDTLVRVLALPPDLPSKDDQLIAEAIWDSANVGHEMVLRVADVVAGRGWVALIHDFFAGSLLTSLHWRAGDLGQGFPSDVAARIALDVLEGLEQSKGLCEANRIPWRPGSPAMGSLYLCSDGRTRALDGQVMAAVTRSAHMRGLATIPPSVASELLDDSSEPDERTDVFAVGVVLWELLTGRSISGDPASIPDLSQMVPPGASVPTGLAQALSSALEFNPAQRQATLRELAVGLVMGAEKVATYEQVLDFASRFLPFEAAFRRAPTSSAPAALPSPGSSGDAEQQGKPQDTATDRDDAQAAATAPDETKVSETFLDEQQASRLPLEEPKPSAAGQVTATALDDTHASASHRHDTGPKSGPPDDSIHSSESSAQRFPSPFATFPGLSGPTGLDEGHRAVVDRSSIPSAEMAENSTDIGTSSHAAALSSRRVAATTPQPIAPNVEKANGGRLEQISWPDDDRARSQSNATRNSASRSSSSKTGPFDSDSENVAHRGSAPHSQRPSDTNAQIARESRQESSLVPQPEPTARSKRRESVRPGSAPKPSSTSPVGLAPAKPTASVRPKASKPIDAVALAEELARVSGHVPRKTGFQISATTLILGFSTTVLAVVLVMVLVLRQSSPQQPAPTPVQTTAPTPPDHRSSGEPAAPQTPVLGEKFPGGASPGLGSKSADAGPPAMLDPRLDRHRRPTKVGGRSGPADDGSDDRPSKRPKHYVPSDL